jgi:hypothetical protein
MAGALIAASITSPNPLTIGSAIHLIDEIYGVQPTETVFQLLKKSNLIKV